MRGLEVGVVAGEGDRGGENSTKINEQGRSSTHFHNGGHHHRSPCEHVTVADVANTLEILKRTFIASYKAKHP